MLADYRSIGALCLVVSAIMLWQRARIQGGMGKNWLRSGVIAAIAVAVLATLLWLTQDQFSERRQQSNIGRYVGLLVAWRAINESPLIGYGSWAADERFGRMFKAEVERIDRDNPRSENVRRSLLPHSQLLQAWVEGGVLGLAFFVFYGVRLVGALRWLAWKRPPDVMTPLFLYFLMSGLWNLFASPFLGFHRIYVALAVALIAVAAHERRHYTQAGIIHGNSVD
jgi:O-antigen ligase